jgi:hypothetical protein
MHSRCPVLLVAMGNDICDGRLRFALQEPIREGKLGQHMIESATAHAKLLVGLLEAEKKHNEIIKHQASRRPP